MRKKILIVSGGFYPSISPRSFRTTELAKEFARQGHEVKVIIPFSEYNYKNLSIETNIEIETYNCNWKKNLKIDKNNFSIINRFINRALILLFEYPGIEIMFRVANMLKKVSGYDMLISIAVPYPVHWGVAKAYWKNKQLCRTWVADCGDPYMGCNKTANTFNRHPFYFEYVEKWFSRRADFITIPIENAKDSYYPEFHKKIRIIPQGFNFQELPTCNSFVKNKTITFAYAGAFIQGYRDPRPFLAYLSSLSYAYKFIVYTNSDGFNFFDDYKDILYGKLEIHSYIPRLELLANLCKVDFLINFENSDNIQSPSKLIDYALTGRPILSVGSREIHKKTIDEFLNRNYSNKTIVNNIEQYNIKNVANSFLSLIQ